MLVLVALKLLASFHLHKFLFRDLSRDINDKLQAGYFDRLRTVGLKKFLSFIAHCLLFIADSLTPIAYSIALSYLVAQTQLWRL